MLSLVLGCEVFRITESMLLKTCAARTLNDHSLRERASVIMCCLRIQPEMPPSQLISARSHFTAQSFHYLVEHLMLNACQFLKVDCLTCPVNTGTAKIVGLGGFGKFGVCCVARWQCRGFLVGLLEERSGISVPLAVLHTAVCQASSCKRQNSWHPENWN